MKTALYFECCALDGLLARLFATSSTLALHLESRLEVDLLRLEKLFFFIHTKKEKQINILKRRRKAEYAKTVRYLPAFCSVRSSSPRVSWCPFGEA